MTPEERLRGMMAAARGEDAITESQWEGFTVSARRSLRVQRMVAGAVAVVLLVGAGIGGAALFGDLGGRDGAVLPADSPTPDGCRDIDAPWDPEACNYDPDAPTPTTSSPTVLPSEGEDKAPGGSVKQPPLLEREFWMVDRKDPVLGWGTTYVEITNGDELSSVIEFLISPNAALGPVQEAGETTAIPAGTELLDARIEDGVAVINLSSEFDDDEPVRPGSLRLREAQVVFTATQLETVESARILVEGDPYLDQVGSRDRRDYDDIAPPIIVESPEAGAEVTSPLTVSGTADVFEATVSIDLVFGNRKNDKVIETFATATCGSGCRGEFATELEFDVSERTQARLEVYEESAEDGSKIYWISLPVVLLPD